MVIKFLTDEVNLIRDEKQQRLVIKTYIFMKEKSLKEH